MVALSKVKVAYGERVLFSDSDLLVRPGDKIGLVGPNGAGKTTVFRLIAGEETPDEGEVSMDPGEVMGYFSQDVGEMAGGTAIAAVLSGAGRVHEIALALTELEHRMSDPEGPGLSDAEMGRYGELQSEFLHLDGYELETRAQAVLSGLGIGKERWEAPLETFSGGWKMRIALARILLLSPDVLLIDEPTNHLDIESILWLEEWLNAFKGSLVMTCHDRDFMTRICDRTVEVAQGSITTYSGDYDFYLRERDIRRERLLASAKRQQAMLAKEEEFIARFAARASHAAQVQSRIKTIGKIERVEVPPDPKEIAFAFAQGNRSGDLVVEMKGLSKSYALPDGRELPVLRGIDATVSRKQKIAVAGANGAGKSTLLKIVAGLAPPSSGACAPGASLSLGYFSQYSTDTLDARKTVFEELAERLPKQSVASIRNLLGAFQFRGDEADKRVSVLSGGERTRVMLALLLCGEHNFLVLDEPTNHLDIASREVLLKALMEFEGTVMIVSHDRYFLRHLATRVFEIDGGRLRTYEGDYSYYLGKRESLA